VFADQIAAAIDAARGLAALDDLSKAIWRGLTAGVLNDEDAQRLAECIHTRRMAAKGDKKTAIGPSRPAGLLPPTTEITTAAYTQPID